MHFFSTKLRSSGHPKNDAKTLSFHPPSPFHGIFATATVLAFVLLPNSRFNFHCYIHSVKQRLLRNRPGSEAATSRDFLREKLQRAFTRANQLHWTAQQSCNRLPQFPPAGLYVRGHQGCGQSSCQTYAAVVNTLQCAEAAEATTSSSLSSTTTSRFYYNLKSANKSCPCLTVTPTRHHQQHLFVYKYLVSVTLPECWTLNSCEHQLNIDMSNGFTKTNTRQNTTQYWNKLKAKHHRILKQTQGKISHNTETNTKQITIQYRNRHKAKHHTILKQTPAFVLSVNKKSFDLAENRNIHYATWCRLPDMCMTVIER